MLYKIGDKVVHQRECACLITKIIDMEMNQGKREYFVLEPLMNKKSNVYISTEQAKQNSIRPIVDLDALEVLDHVAAIRDEKWISDARDRYRSYSKTISTFEFREVMEILICFIIQKEIKDLTAKDNEMMLAAEKLICSEIAMLSDQTYEQVLEDLRDRILSA